MAGFTLVELMIVIVIIGILASVVMPRFNLELERHQDDYIDYNLDY